MEKPTIAGKTPLPVQLEAGKTYAWCSCGESTNQPFCDGSHKGSAFVPKVFVAEETKTAEKSAKLAVIKTGGKQYLVEEGQTIKIEKSQSLVLAPFGKITITKGDTIDGTAKNIAFVDANLMNSPLTLRQWREGDYFYPSGMTGKKKLSKYFKDEKFSLLDKKNVWLLCSGDDIVWVLNHRADNRYIVTEDTKDILKIEIS